MPSDDKLLEIISNETKSSINSMDIVTPSIYTSIFSKFATRYNTDLTDENKLTDKMLDKKISLMSNIQNENLQNATKLSQHTSNAISAIKEKDDTLLQQVLQETEALRLEIEKLKENMYKDELTAVYNRKWLNDTYLKDTSNELNTSGVLAIIDLNYFKIINDTFGHVVGDKVLIFIANQLRSTKEPILRYGGDEFIILFSNSISPAGATDQLNKIRENLLHKHLKLKELSFRTSFSFGVCNFLAGDSLANIIEIADKNMYQDKLQIKQRITGIDIE
jgi:diguanylate cyclase (GGDEF)-like protein